MAMVVPGPGKTHTATPLTRGDGVVNPRLRGERQCKHTIMADALAIIRNAVGIRSKNEVEELGRLDEKLKIRRVFLVVENRRDVPISAPLDDFG